MNKDKWLLSFSGFFLLLFALFVVLYASTQLKNKELLNELNEKKIQQTPVTTIERIKEIQNQVSSPDLSAQVTEKGIEVRFLVSDFYADQSFIPHADVLPVIDRFGQKLKNLNLKFSIIGHADISEKSTDPQKKLEVWVLTVQRAAWILERWKEKFQLDVSRVTVSSRLYFEPRAESETEKSEWIKNQNKRVEIILHPSLEGIQT